MNSQILIRSHKDRRSFIGGSDARIIMGSDESALIRLWREKRGETEPADLSGNLIVQLGTVTEDLNRRWYELNSGHVIKDVQKRAQHQVIRWMAATLDGVVESTGAVFEAKFMLPWSFSEEAAAEKHMAQLQHNMWVIQSRSAVLSIITGGGKWVEDDHSSRPALPASPAHRGEEVLALRRAWRGPSSIRRRAASTSDRGGPDRRHDLIEFLGGIGRGVLPDPPGFPQS